MGNKRRHLVKSDKQLAALASSIRQEIADVLAASDTVSVAELAATLGRPADALYFHLHRLTQSGLVQQAGYRSRGNRQEALYRTAAPEMMIEYKPKKPSNRKAVSAIVASMLRLGARDFSRALQREGVIVSGAHRELWALRKASRLSLRQLADVNRVIQRLTSAMARPAASGQLYAVTVMLTPLDRRRKSDRIARAAKAAKQKHLR